MLTDGDVSGKRKRGGRSRWASAKHIASMCTAHTAAMCLLSLGLLWVLGSAVVSVIHGLQQEAARKPTNSLYTVSGPRPRPRMPARPPPPPPPPPPRRALPPSAGGSRGVQDSGDSAAGIESLFPSKEASLTESPPQLAAQHEPLSPAPVALESDDWGRWGPLVASFRAGHVDWHDLVVFRAPGGADAALGPDDFARLVAAETRLTEALLPHLAESLARFGHDHGPLRSLSQCSAIADKCGVLSRSDCLQSSLCGWCRARELCMQRRMASETLPFQGERGCPAGQLEIASGANECGRSEELWRLSVTTGEVSPVASADECPVVLSERLFAVAPSDEAEDMYFHWLHDFFEGFVARVRLAGALADRRNLVVNVRRAPAGTAAATRRGTFYSFFGLVSRFCPLQLHDLPHDVCFCEPPGRAAEPRPQQLLAGLLGDGTNLSDEDTAADASCGSADPLACLLVRQLGLEAEVPTAPRIGFVSRTRKRFLLNEEELAASARARGFETVFLPLERMTLYEQVRELRRVTVLVGMHGSAMVNLMFLCTGCVGVQILPFNMDPREGAFARTYAERAGVLYRELAVEDAAHATMHWHFADARLRALRDQPAELARRRARISDDGSQFFTFWLQQDSRLPPEQWAAFLDSIFREGVHASMHGAPLEPASKRR